MFPTLLNSLGWEFSLVILRYGTRWRAQRRLFHQAFRPEAVISYQPTVTTKAHELLVNLLDSPERYIDHARKYVTSRLFAEHKLTHSY